MVPLADLRAEPSVHTGNCGFQRYVGSASQRAQREEKECSYLVSPLHEVLKTSKIHLAGVQICTSLAGEAGIKVEKFIPRVYMC